MKYRVKHFETCSVIYGASGQWAKTDDPGFASALGRGYQPLTYLACPYSHPDKKVRRRRFVLVTQAAAWWMKAHPRSNVFSPLTHSHPLHEIAGMDGSWQFWKRIDTQYLRLCSRMVVLTLDGWKESVGVQAEIKIAKRLNIPITYLTIDE
jgi:hypothetical protein